MITQKFVSIYDVCIPNDLLQLMYNVQAGLTKSDVFVLLDVLQHGGANNAMPISRKQIAIDCNLSVPSVKRALKHLQDIDIITYDVQSDYHTPSLIALNVAKAPFTQIPMSIFNALMPAKLTFTAIRLLLFVWRNTYGYKGRHGGRIAPALMTDTFIARGTGVDRKNLQRALKELRQVGAIYIDLDNMICKGCTVQARSIRVNNDWTGQI